MTGLLNRRGFFCMPNGASRGAARDSERIDIADVDGLKAVNDELGHDAGDRCIQDSARILQDSFQDGDAVARLGGEEFAAFTLSSTQPQ
jgi:diguanylate cyclase (GGDEF)-like protein